MKKLCLVLIGCLVAGSVWAQKPGKWQNLFDGKTTQGWHNYGKEGVKGWMVMGGSLMTHGGSGDLVTDQEFEDFEMEFEFKIPAKSNSGVMYKVVEVPGKPPYFTGPEYQVIDDEGYPPFNDGGKMVTINDKQKTGANYDMHAPSQAVAKPVGQWNKGRILVKNNQVEHWLNGVKVVAYEYGSDAWKADVAKSKFKSWDYATPHAKGKIALQDHGDEAWYRNIRIRTL
ncbi:DUF1080 domain-containing protein [Rhabdobacter roseus]|uniref:3-keto-alpha-glucoside-1,2-lyase/3-keto-2-hydroxy-glucal hydratase domain-containing protein n=1 Tax=Rhabdobacter roseus TaxID=1655419 RepID=A0A840TNN9_9BACT|nr:DUF1080 domain-containing protein [Rhabdobacter roseus]MBB5284545.1 hypothetical protein [Rhabdobacter roseus]